MVLGLRSKNKKSTSIQVDYLIQLQEIKPWPPSRSLISLRSVVLQWENGDRNSGSTGPAAPSVIEGRIEFNEAFVVRVTLSKEASGKGNGQFYKNMLEFNLYEPRRDKTVKGQLLGSAAVDLAEHGILSEAVTVGVPLNCKRSFRNSTPPVLYLRIQLYEKEGSTSSSRDSLSKEASMDRDGGESVSALMTEEYEEEAEIASFTDDDDDMSSHSSMKQTADENLPEAVDVIASESYLAKPEPEPIAKASESTGDKLHLNESMSESSISELSIDPKRLDNGDSPVSSSPQRSPTTVLEESDTRGIHSTTGIWEGTKAESTFSKIEDSVEKDGLLEEVQHPMVNCRSEENISENEVSKENGVIAIIDRVESSKKELDLASTTTESMDDVKEIDVQEDVHDTGNGSISDVRAGNQERTSLVSDKVKHVSRDSRNSFSSSRVRELELKVEMLEGELREAAAIEAGLYCVVAEHGSSAHKVHTPARRLSRLYIHASKEWSRERKAGSARSAVSGLLLAAKACGNDVPRLTFWLSNSVVLRAIITQSIGYSNLSISGEPIGSEVTPKKRTPLKWESLNQKKGKLSFSDDVGDWEDPYTFTTALEKIEAWMFSRIVESIWWQTLTPHMQMINSKKSYGRKTSFGDQQQANSSIENWKRAFRDACERLCPVRAGGHECGCLPMLARLVMEQCVARLDVAMFNAILRESDDEIPTDPVSDPISDSRVLPIPSGKLSFGSGAQLKNAIGNWSRWLTDLFGMDEDDIPQDENEQEDDRRIQSVESVKSFRLLYALSDLLMLPKDFLLGRSIRKEVCPTFGSSIIKRILDSFFPDEFCPDPIPDSVLEALNSEDPEESSDESIRNFPCDASPIVYSPPSITSIEIIIGDVRSMSTLRRSGSSVVRKCHTSDDELDELDSPLASVIIDKSSFMEKTKGKASGNAVRYRLLREVWRDDD